MFPQAELQEAPSGLTCQYPAQGQGAGVPAGARELGDLPLPQVATGTRGRAIGVPKAVWNYHRSGESPTCGFSETERTRPGGHSRTGRSCIVPRLWGRTYALRARRCYMLAVDRTCAERVLGLLAEEGRQAVGIAERLRKAGRADWRGAHIRAVGAGIERPPLPHGRRGVRAVNSWGARYRLIFSSGSLLSGSKPEGWRSFQSGAPKRSREKESARRPHIPF